MNTSKSSVTKTSVAGAFGLSVILCGCLVSVEPTDESTTSSPTSQIIELAVRLKTHVEILAHEIGPRSYLDPNKLERAAQYIKDELSRPGINAAFLQADVKEFPRSKLAKCLGDSDAAELKKRYIDIDQRLSRLEFKNVELEIKGIDKPDEVIIVGAHYDSDGCESRGHNPGANDNATGVAALIELTKIIKDRSVKRTVRFVAFTNEEEPFFQTEWMGSHIYSHKNVSGGNVKAMLSLETMGYYSEKPNSQKPNWLTKLLGLPHAGNFIAFVGNKRSDTLMRSSVKFFREDKTISFPSVGLTTYEWLLEEIGWSDQWSYWQLDVPAIMVTDTAALRYPCYHEPCDTQSNVDYDRLAMVVAKLAAVIESFADPRKWP